MSGLLANENIIYIDFILLKIDKYWRLKLGLKHD